MASVEHRLATQVHKARYIQTGDPGAVGAGVEWLDTNTTPAIHKKRNAGDSGWDEIFDLADYVAKATVPVTLGFACSDETTAITASTSVLSFRMPHAMTVTGVRASLRGTAASGTFTIDINEGGTTILSTKLTIDATEKTSTTAAAAAVISDATLADDAEITIDIDDDASGDATGLKVWLIGTRSV